MYTAFGQGARWSARERVLGACARRPEWSGAIGTQAGGSGQAKRNETKGGVLIAEYLGTWEAIYILRCTRRPRGTYECGTRLCATAGRLGARPSDVSGLRSRCRSVGIVSQLALNLRPNVAGIGTLHLLATLYSDPRSDVMRRVSESERRGSGGWVRKLGIEKSLSCGRYQDVQQSGGWH